MNIIRRYFGGVRKVSQWLLNFFEPIDRKNSITTVIFDVVFIAHKGLP